MPQFIALIFTEFDWLMPLGYSALEVLFDSQLEPHVFANDITDFHSISV